MKTLRHNALRFVAALAAMAALAGCASGPDVRGDYDRAADFSKYRTYNFLSESDANGTEFRSIAQQMMQQAASREMESRGYVKAQDPDLLINFKGKLEEKTDIQSTPAPYYGPSYGYRGWYGAPYGAYGYGGTEITTRRYNVGTLVMDVIDREKRVAVFQGGFEGVVSKKMMEDKEGTLNNAVAAIFSKYPFVAGQGTPVAPADPKK
ncbi:MAG: DUF4136 domain-containing protein [Gammaproteobacteria bacterium]|nr:DUF4136 domain-containing protein [Gammaproteobacteria bacterium]